MTEDPARNVALLIDADNASADAIDPVLTVLAELGTVNVRRAYANWMKSEVKGWRDVLPKHGIEPVQQFDLTRGKNATDMKMTIDAMDLLWGRRVEGFGLMSSDSDFMPLAMRIRQDGVPVYGFGRGKTPEGFRAACTRFIDVDALAAEVAARPRIADVPLAESLPPSIASGLPAPAAPARAAKVDAELLQLLIDAYDSLKRDDRGYANLSALGQLAGNRSSFDARNYGFKRLSDLIAAVPNFAVEQREGGQLFVKRVR